MRSTDRFLSDNTPRMRYTLNREQRVCGCWCDQWLSSEANAIHISVCQTYRHGGDWYDTVTWWLKIWWSSSH